MKIVPDSFLIMLAFMFLAVSSFAAAPEPPPPSPPPPPGLPIDSGIVVLLCAALIFGFYKIYQARVNRTSH